MDGETVPQWKNAAPGWVKNLCLRDLFEKWEKEVEKCLKREKEKEEKWGKEQWQKFKMWKEVIEEWLDNKRQWLNEWQWLATEFRWVSRYGLELKSKVQEWKEVPVNIFATWEKKFKDWLEWEKTANGQIAEPTFQGWLIEIAQWGEVQLKILEILKKEVEEQLSTKKEEKWGKKEAIKFEEWEKEVEKWWKVHLKSFETFEIVKDWLKKEKEEKKQEGRKIERVEKRQKGVEEWEKKSVAEREIVARLSGITSTLKQSFLPSWEPIMGLTKEAMSQIEEVQDRSKILAYLI